MNCGHESDLKIRDDVLFAGIWPQVLWIVPLQLEFDGVATALENDLEGSRGVDVEKLVVQSCKFLGFRSFSKSLDSCLKSCRKRTRLHT